MICRKCGNQIEDTSKFCPVCGTPVTPIPVQPVPPAPAAASAGGQPPKKKKSGKGLKIGLIAGSVILAIALVITVAAVVLINRPQVKLARAFQKTFSAYSTAAENGLPADLPAILKQASLRQDFALELVEPPYGLPQSLRGLRLDISAGWNPDAKEADLILKPAMGSARLAEIDLAAQDSLVMAACPDLFPDSWFGANTKTLGKDLAALGIMEPGLETLGFNLFDLHAMSKEYWEQNKGMLKNLEPCVKTLLKSLKIEKVGSQTISVHNVQKECTRYLLNLSKEDLKQFLTSVVDVSANASLGEYPKLLCDALNLPAEVAEAMFPGLYEPDYQSLYEEIARLTDSIGDLELYVYVHDGAVACVQHSRFLDGDNYCFELFMGGKDNYADHISFVMTANETSQLRIGWEGNHTDPSKPYVSTLYGELVEDRKVVDRYSLEISYDASKAADNFELKNDLQWMQLTASGTLLADQTSLSLELPALQVVQYGEHICTLGVGYFVGPYEPVLTPGEPIMVLELAEEQLQKYLEQAQELFQGILQGFFA